MRMENKQRKQYLDLEGMPILNRTLMVFAAAEVIQRIVLVVPESDLTFCRDDLLGRITPAKPVQLVGGGPSRQASVYNGLSALDCEDEDLVAIHDAVRPFVAEQDLRACLRAAGEFGACILGLHAFDTVKRVGSNNQIEATLDRESLWLAQTPQVFKYRLIQNAHELALKNGLKGTDDASLLEMTGHPVRILPGSRLNMKITTPEDLPLAKAIINLKLI